MGHKKGFKTDKKRLKQLSHWKLTGAGGDGNETVFDPFSSILLPFVTFCCIFELVLFSLFLSSVFFFKVSLFHLRVLISPFLSQVVSWENQLSGEVAGSQK